ncbi:MAG TPA: SurA N-terminal domain-containing protein, partial [bacterium]|nr:SurA N-terminal domain-containing protein [bacterium]
MKIILWAVAILIIPGFLIWGVGLGGGNKGANYAATVNREPIILRDYYKSLGDMEQRYREMFGEGAEGFLKNINMEKIVLDNMIRERLLLQQARKKRIKVPNNEVIEAIKSDPVFKDEKGAFDQKKYKEIITAYPTEELRKIEDDIRKRIMLDKLKELVVSEANIIVADADVDEYIKKHQITSTDRELIRKNLMRQKREESFNSWYEGLMKKSKINIYLSLEKPSEAAPKPSTGDKTE